MSQFCSIQELCSFEGSEASPLIAHPSKIDLTPTQTNINANGFGSMTSSQNPYEEKSPTLEGLVFDCDLDAIVRKPKRDYQEGLFLYKHLKETSFFKDFKFQYGRDLRTTDALLHLSRVLKYEYYAPKSVIYKKGDLSNQRVYLVYSGEVNAWVGKPDANALKPSNRIIPEILESTPKASNDFSSSIKSGGFGGQSTKIRRRQNRISHPIQRGTPAETPKAIAQTAPKARTLKKQFTFEGIFSNHKEGSGMSETNLCSTNSHTLNDDSETHSREILHARPPSDSRRSVELEKAGVGLSNRRLQPKTLSRSITLDIKNIDERTRFTHEDNPDDYGFTTKSSLKEEKEFDFSDTVPTEPAKDPYFVLRRVNLQRSHTMNLDIGGSNRNTSEGGYVRQTIRKGGHFGDEILKSSQPREETLITTTACELLVFNVEAFEYLMTRFERTNTKVLNFILDHIPGLEEALNQKKIMRPDLSFKEESYQLHNHILVEGNKGKKIYLLYEGTCQVMKSIDGSSKNKGPRKPYTSSGDMILCMLQPGVFIGEEILFNQDGLFEYTIKAASAPVKLLSISAQAFKDSMPKIAYSTLESLYVSKKQKNLEIMDTRAEFSRIQQASSPKAAEAEIAMATKILKTQSDSYATRNFQVASDAAKNNRFFARPYTVELAVPGGQECPKVVDGLRFKRHATQPPEAHPIQVSMSKEKEEKMVEEPVERMSEGERKLRRYLHQGMIKKSVTPKASNEKFEEFPLVKGRSHEENVNSHNISNSKTENGIQRLQKLSIANYGRKHENEKPASMKENDSGFASKRREFEGFSGKRLNQILAYVSPTREKFAGFVGSVPNLPQRFTQGAQEQRSEGNLAIKVKVNVKTKRVTYGVQNVRNGNQNDLKGYDLFGNTNINSAAHPVVKTASSLKSDMWLKSKLSERKTISLRETPENFVPLGDYNVESRLTGKLEGLERMSKNLKKDEWK